MSNLPPGVNVNDIPGNRPEDEANERFWEELDRAFSKNYPNLQKTIMRLMEDDDVEIILAITGYVELARDMGYSAGYAKTGQEASLRVSGRELVLLERFHAAGWRIGDDGDPYQPDGLEP